MSNAGYLYFERPHYKSGLMVNGHRFANAEGDGSCPPFNFKRLPAFAIAENQARTFCSQGRLVAPDQPLSMASVSGSLRFLLKWEEEVETLRYALGLAQPTTLFFGDWHTDVWALTVAEASRTEWRTSRPLPYDQPAPLGNATWFAPESYSPIARLVDAAGAETDQTVIATGTPGDGEVLVPDTGGGLFETIETPAVSTLAGYVYLALHYPALYRVRAAIAYDAPVANGLEVQLDFEELPAGTYGVSA